MALPKKGSRKITVDGIVYRWRGHISRYEGDNYGELFVERFDEPRQKIKATFTWVKLHQEYKKVGQKLQVIIDHPPPQVVRESILYALKHGWHPGEGGGALDLGNLDEKLPFDLKPQEPLEDFVKRLESTEEFVKRVALGKKLEEVFTPEFLLENRKTHAPAYRTALFKYFIDDLQKARKPQGRRPWFETEHGIDGDIYDCNVLVWGAYEFSPWELKQVMTLVLWDFNIASDADDLDQHKKPGILRVNSGAMLFIAGDLIVPRLEIFGEVHCLGRVKTDFIQIAPDAYLSQLKSQ